MERVSAGKWNGERVKAKLAQKSHGAYFFWRWHKATSKTGICFHRGIFCFDRWPLVGYDAGTERPFWPGREGNPALLK